MVGEAAKPQTLPYNQKMTLLDVMIAVGGITEFADGNRATLLRHAPRATSSTASGSRTWSSAAMYPPTSR